MYKTANISRITFPAWLSQILKFTLVGMLNTLIDTGIYFVLTRWFGLGSMLVLAKGISFTIGMINSFIWNRNWTFNSDTIIWRAATLFTFTQMVALGINAGIMALCLNFLHLSEIVSLGYATVVAFSWNFVITKVIVFRV